MVSPRLRKASASPTRWHSHLMAASRSRSTRPLAPSAAAKSSVFRCPVNSHHPPHKKAHKLCALFLYILFLASGKRSLHGVLAVQILSLCPSCLRGSTSLKKGAQPCA